VTGLEEAYLSDLLKLNIEDESRVGGDGTGEAASTVAVVRGDDKSSLLAKLHLDDTLVPTLDDLANADRDIKVTASDGAVKPFERVTSVAVSCKGEEGELTACPSGRSPGASQCTPC
jgi:hypothetical protein